MTLRHRGHRACEAVSAALYVALPVVRSITQRWKVKRGAQQACFLVVQIHGEKGSRARDVHDLIPWPGPPTNTSGYRVMATPPEVMERVWLLAMHSVPEAQDAWAAAMLDSGGRPMCVVLVDNHTAIFLDENAAFAYEINAPGGSA